MPKCNRTSFLLNRPLWRYQGPTAKNFAFSPGKPFCRSDLWRVNTDQEYHEEVRGAMARETGLTFQQVAPKAMAGVANTMCPSLVCSVADRMGSGLSPCLGGIQRGGGAEPWV